MASIEQSPSDAAPRVTVVIPTFNRAPELERVLSTLFDHPGTPLSVIVVDNSSTDGTDILVEKESARWQGRLHYLRKTPEGPASARNAGLARAQTEFVLFHDSDVELLGSWIELALRRMDAEPALAAVGGYVVYGFDPGRSNAYGGDLSPLGLAWDVDEGRTIDPDQPEAERIWVNCSAMLARCEVVRQAGGFDETFFYGYEDSDLGWRLCLMGGRVRVLPELRALHHVDSSPGVAHPQIVFHYCKNRLRSVLRNAEAGRIVWVLAAYLAYSLADLLVRAPRAAKLRALAWNLSRLSNTLDLRRTTQELRVVADRDLFRVASGRWFPPTRLGGRRRRPVASATGASSRRGAASVQTDDRL